MTTEIQQKADIFQALLDRARKSNGREITIATFARDTVSPLKKNSSCFGITDEKELNHKLDEFISTLVPSGESRQTLESGFEADPNLIIPHSHYDEAITEWDTVVDRIVIGIRSISDQRSESSRTWYVRSGEVSDHDVAFLQEERGPIIANP